MKTIRHLTVYSLLLFNTIKPMIIESGFEDWNPYCLQSMPEEVLREIATSATGFSQEDLKAAPYYQNCIKFSQQYYHTNITLTPEGNSLIVAYQNIINTLSLVNKELYTTLSASRERLLSTSKQKLNGNPLLNLGYFKHFCIIRRAEQDEVFNENERECEFSSAIKRCCETGKPFFKIYNVFFYNVNEEDILKLPLASESLAKPESLAPVENFLNILKDEALRNNKKFDPTKYIGLLNYFNTITYSKGGYGLVNSFRMSADGECRIINKDDLEKSSKEDEYTLPYKVIENFINIQEDNQ